MSRGGSWCCVGGGVIWVLGIWDMRRVSVMFWVIIVGGLLKRKGFYRKLEGDLWDSGGG